MSHQLRSTEDYRDCIAGWLRAHPGATTRDVARAAGLSVAQALGDLRALQAARVWDDDIGASRWSLARR